MAGALDIFVAYKFIKILTTPYKKTKAYQLGIIGDKGQILKKRKDLKSGEKQHYTAIHGLIWNLKKKILDKLPPTRTRLGSFATGLWLLKEELSMTDSSLIEDTFLEHIGEERVTLNEMFSNATSKSIKKGDYIIKEGCTPAYDFVKPGDLININNTRSIANILGTPIYEGTHKLTNERVVITNEELLRI